MRTTTGVVFPLAIAVAVLLIGACAPQASEQARSLPETLAPTAPTVPPTTTSRLPAAPAVTVTSTTSSTIATPETTRRPTVRIAMVGDVMLGRGLSRIVRNDPQGIFEDVRFVLSDVDVAGANMESPLTNRPHIALNPYALEARPESAGLLAAAGFDVLTVANNHAGDAGRASVIDSIEAIDDAGMRAVGGGANLSDAVRPAIVEVRGLRVGFLAFDATRAGTPAREDRAGIAPWDDELVRTAVTELRPSVDLLVVAVHGGVEYRTSTDPYMAALAEKLNGWGADVVWGSGPHVVQPVFVIDGARPTVVATSLGNFLFDQGDSATKVGAILEVLADADGVVAYRVATVQHRDRRVHFDRWDLPGGDAVMLGTEWWSLGRGFEPVVPDEPKDLEQFRWGDVIDATRGDVDGDGRDEIVVAFRRPYQESPVNVLFPDRPWTDVLGRSAHLGVFRAPDLEPEWIAGTLFRSVRRVVACDGSLAVGYGSDATDGGMASGAWRWRGFGFLIAPTLDRDAALGCADVDGDGRTDPILLQRPGDS
ncbi:capsule biosynthesis protein CapA [bacterium BMS3Abin02]|nr:capsule biosynthesis protein CapA [bacterium BMS3Abin02]HDL48574.1 CapA family protein [Actinomycetota bacterium]